MKPVEAPHFRVKGSQQDQPFGDHIQPVSDEEAETIRRIRACVTACEGISTEELEQGVVQDMQRVLREVAPIIEAWGKEPQQPATQN